MHGLNKSKDNIGFFPLYFFVHNLVCEDISMQLTFWDTKGVDEIDKWRNPKRSELECVDNEYTGAIHFTPPFDYQDFIHN